MTATGEGRKFRFIVRESGFRTLIRGLGKILQIPTLDPVYRGRVLRMKDLFERKLAGKPKVSP